MNHTLNTHLHPHPATFEKAREALATIKALRPALSATELETLALLLDTDAMETIQQSIEEAEVGKIKPLEDAVARA